jgi:CBS domain-containing protein
MTSKQDKVANIPVSDFMTKNVITISEGQTMKQAAKLMYEDDIGSIVTLMEGSTNGKKEPVGIVTERDIAKTVGFAAKHSIFGDIPLSEIMSKPLITIRPSASLKDAVVLMQQKDIRRLPILNNDGRLVGIITEKDILRAVFKTFKETTEGKGLASEGFDLLGFLGAE